MVPSVGVKGVFEIGPGPMRIRSNVIRTRILQMVFIFYVFVLMLQKHL